MEAVAAVTAEAALVAAAEAAAVVVVEEAAAAGVVEALPPTQVTLRFRHRAEHRSNAFASI